MKRWLNLGLLMAFQFCYLEWPNNSMYLFEATIEIFSKTENWISNFTHPIILTALLTQLVLLIGVISPQINRKLHFIAVLLLSILVSFFFVIGLLGSNFKIALSTVPFLILAALYFYSFFKNKA